MFISLSRISESNRMPQTHNIIKQQLASSSFWNFVIRNEFFSSAVLCTTNTRIDLYAASEKTMRKLICNLPASTTLMGFQIISKTVWKCRPKRDIECDQVVYNKKPRTVEPWILRQQNLCWQLVYCAHLLCGTETKSRFNMWKNN